MEGFTFFVGPVIFYIIVIGVTVAAILFVKGRNTKIKREARQRGEDEAKRMKKREAQRLLNRNNRQLGHKFYPHDAQEEITTDEPIHVRIHGSVKD